MTIHMFRIRPTPPFLSSSSDLSLNLPNRRKGNQAEHTNISDNETCLFESLRIAIIHTQTHNNITVSLSHRGKVLIFVFSYRSLSKSFSLFASKFSAPFCLEGFFFDPLSLSLIIFKGLQTLFCLNGYVASILINGWNLGF